jgi:hypothetical protein
MLAYLFVLVAVVVRLLPHPFSFTPVGASLLFFGAHAPRKRAWIPLALLAASDVFLTKVHYGYPFSADHFATWAWYAAVLLMGGLLRNNARPLRVLAAGLATAVSFFLVSNLAVWAVWNMYPKTFGGLLTSYAVALPYFRNEVAADVGFAALMFSLPALVELLRGARKGDRIAAA